MMVNVLDTQNDVNNCCSAEKPSRILAIPHDDVTTQDFLRSMRSATDSD